MFIKRYWKSCRARRRDNVFKEILKGFESTHGLNLVWCSIFRLYFNKGSSFCRLLRYRIVLRNGINDTHGNLGDTICVCRHKDKASEVSVLTATQVMSNDIILCLLHTGISLPYNVQVMN